MKRIIIILFLLVSGATFISGQEETSTYKRDPGIYFGIGPGMYISSFVDRDESGTEPPYESVKVLSEGQTAVTLNGIIFFEFHLPSHISIQPEIGINSCRHDMNYYYERGPNYPQRDTGNYELSYYNTQFTFLINFDLYDWLSFSLGPFLNIPFSEKCEGQVISTDLRWYGIPGRSKTDTIYNEMIHCDLKPCLGIAASVGLNLNAWKIPLLLELKAGITLTETGIPPETSLPARRELFVSINLNYLLRL
jgi:hypothetical protein